MVKMLRSRSKNRLHKFKLKGGDILQYIFAYHNGAQYGYYYIETSKAILVFKDGKFIYTLNVIFRHKAPWLRCSCPGGTYHKKCHHMDTAKEFDFHKTVKPTSWLDESNQEYIKDFLLERG